MYFFSTDRAFGPKWSNLVYNETHPSLPGGSKNNCHKEQTESLHETVLLTATWKCARSLCIVSSAPPQLTLFPLFPRCDSSPSCPQNLSLLGRYARGLSPHVEKLAFKCFKYSRRVCFWQRERACERVASFQAEVLPPSGILIFLRDSGGLSGGLQIKDPVTSALQTLRWLISCPQRGPAWMEVEETINVQENVPQMIHLCPIQRIYSHLYLKIEFWNLWEQLQKYQ